MTLPPLLEDYLARNAPEPLPAGERVILHQSGAMRLRPEGRWSPFTGEQWLAVGEVGFCWHARLRVAPLITAVVEDAFEGGHGRLDVKLWGALHFMHDDGSEMDRGEAERYLAELPWNPGAFRRNPHLQFDAWGERTVRVFHGDAETWVDLRFDELGDISGVYTETRVYADHGPTPWEGHYRDYGELGGVRVPRHGEVSWLVPEGDFTYWRGQIEGLEWA
ncbi:MAG: hypothetical protein H6740_28290 [Alphaproteobacteria bacterium]|nr:hypothetical protein [Alphaproteobacteria bacterium]